MFAILEHVPGAVVSSLDLEFGVEWSFLSHCGVTKVIVRFTREKLISPILAKFDASFIKY